MRPHSAPPSGPLPMEGGKVARAYYNEIDPYAAQWLRNLISAGHIAPGDVDERSIVDVRPDDLAGYTQCHFFAGIGGWSYAARLAGFPDERPLWTGSCPCQPWSRVGRSEGFDSDKHLWPSWFRLIAGLRPPVLMGEQVATAAGRGWWDQVAADLDRAAYASRAVNLRALSVGAPHERRRLWFVAHAVGERDRISQEEVRAGRPVPEHSTWWSSEPAVGRVVDGLPSRMAELGPLGNAIVPQVAAEVIAAFLDIEPQGARHG